MHPFIMRSFLTACAYYYIDNQRSAARMRANNIETDSGMAHSGLSVEQSLRYIEDVFKDYKHYAGISKFYGRVAEVGPGDNCGVGLMFLVDGCEHVDLIDRFYSKRNSTQHGEIYRALFDRHPQLREFFSGVDFSDETKFRHLCRHYGEAAAAEEFFVKSTGYDFIVSRAVMEHVYSPSVAIRNMAMALNPGGMLLHKVDLRDHNMFSSAFHELKFLEVPDWLYSLITKDAGRPNRILTHEYKAVLSDVLPDYKILVTRLAGVGDITPHIPYEQIPIEQRTQSISYVRSVRHSFAKSLRSVTDEDLSIAGIFLIGRKTA